MKKLMLGLMMAFAVTAEAEIVKEYTLTDSLTATLDDQGVLTINGNGAMPNWELASDQAWSNECSQIKSVVADGEIIVGELAFLWCDKLTSVSLPNATTIGKMAFFGCENLKEVFLPNATTIGVSAFCGCEKLTSVSLPNVTTIGRSAFEGCGSLTSIVLPNATTVGELAFGGCSSLASVSLPNATTIWISAFEGCDSLTSVYLPNATTIKDDAFNGCEKLETVILSFRLLSNPNRERWGLRDEAKLLKPFTNDEVKNAAYKVAVFAGEKLMSEENYKKGCAYYGITPKQEPQAVQEDEIAVKKESIAAPSAGTVKAENNTVQLGVTVLKTSDLTAEKKDWDKVKITKDDIDVDEDGNIIVNVPVDSSSGFMILQSKDAKIETAE